MLARHLRVQLGEERPHVLAGLRHCLTDLGERLALCQPAFGHFGGGQSFKAHAHQVRQARVRLDQGRAQWSVGTAHDDESGEFIALIDGQERHRAMSKLSGEIQQRKRQPQRGLLGDHRASADVATNFRHVAFEHRQRLEHAGQVGPADIRSTVQLEHLVSYRQQDGGIAGFGHQLGRACQHLLTRLCADEFAAGGEQTLQFLHVRLAGLDQRHVLDRRRDLVRQGLKHDDGVRAKGPRFRALHVQRAQHRVAGADRDADLGARRRAAAGCACAPGPQPHPLRCAADCSPSPSR